MELDTHRAILYCAFKRCADELDLKNDLEYQKVFHPLWMGNWLTDMNQASAFLTIMEGMESNNSNNNWKIKALTFLKKIVLFKKLKEAIIAVINKQEIASARKRSESTDSKTDYYDSWKDGKYVIPKILLENKEVKKSWETLFQKLWNTEWKSALAAFDLSEKIGDIAEHIKIENNNTTVGDAHDIGAYYPFDHFDVAEYFAGKTEDISEERELNHYPLEGSHYMTYTANHALQYALNDWIKKAFDSTEESTDIEQTKRNRLSNLQALKELGHGTHTLQDFYAHSNYSDLLLICMAQENGLDKFWSKHIEYLTDENLGIFNAFYLVNGKGNETPLVTGRFDTIDTIHALMHTARESLVSFEENPFEENTEGQSQKKSQRDQIIFGTFTHINGGDKLRSSYDAFSKLNDTLGGFKSMIKTFIIEKIIDPKINKALEKNNGAKETYDILKHSIIDDDQKLVNYTRGAKLFYFEKQIEEFLESKIKKAEEKNIPVLPHHSLLAKDHDKNSRAVKLSYKLACSLAAEVSTEVLIMYFKGESFDSVKTYVEKRFMHPKFHLEDCKSNSHLTNVIDDLNKGWLWYASKNPKEKKSILGFELDYL